MNIRGNNKGQMKISFGMIVSIILIVFFLAFAIYGIIWFLKAQKAAKVGIFMQNFQDDVHSLWGGTYGEQTHEYYLPKDIEYVCLKKPEFTEEVDMFFYPRDYGINIAAINISYLDLDKSTSTENKRINPLVNMPYNEPSGTICIKNVQEKVTIKLTKKYGERAVTVSRG